MSIEGTALNPVRLVAAALIGLVILLVLIIKFKIQAMVAILIGAISIGLIAGMPFEDIVTAVNDGIGNTLKGIALLVGLGSMFGAILEVSGGAQTLAVTMVRRFGDKKAAWALGITGLVIAMPVFFDAGLIIRRSYETVSAGIFTCIKNQWFFSVLCNSPSCRTCSWSCFYSAYTGTGSGGNHAERRPWMGYYGHFLRSFCNDRSRSCVGFHLRKEIYDPCSGACGRAERY